MISLPLPIVVALVLLVVFLFVRERLLQSSSGWLFALLILSYCLGLGLVGLRWGYGLTAMLPLMAIQAAFWGPLAWIAFRSLNREGAVWRWRADWPHALPLAGVLLGLALSRDIVDLVLLVTYLSYGVLLWRLSRRGPDAMSMVRLGAAPVSLLALRLTAALLLFIALVDVLIALEFHLHGGRRAAAIVAWANLPSLLLMGLAAVVAGQARSQAESPEPSAVAQQDSDADAGPEAEQERRAAEDDEAAQSQALYAQLRQLLVEQGLYADSELNLQRLARKCGVPARKVSRAVNLHTGQNVSQWVNEQRVAAATELLGQGERSVTEVMLAVGFATKSNFNREFKRVTGTSPSGWRERAAQHTTS